MKPRSPKLFLICVDNRGYPVSLEKGKRYAQLRDVRAEKQGLVRIVDESGESYLYPKAMFRPATLTRAVA